MKIYVVQTSKNREENAAPTGISEVFRKTRSAWEFSFFFFFLFRFFLFLGSRLSVYVYRHKTVEIKSREGKN